MSPVCVLITCMHAPPGGFKDTCFRLGVLVCVGAERCSRMNAAGVRCSAPLDCCRDPTKLSVQLWSLHACVCRTLTAMIASMATGVLRGWPQVAVCLAAVMIRRMRVASPKPSHGLHRLLAHLAPTEAFSLCTTQSRFCLNFVACVSRNG